MVPHTAAELFAQAIDRRGAQAEQGVEEVGEVDAVGLLQVGDADADQEKARGADLATSRRARFR
jgi:hypothetical protein